MSLVETTARTVRWQIDDVAKKMEDGMTVVSPTFDNDRWMIKLLFGKTGTEGTNDKFCAIHLHHCLTASENVRPSWQRKVSVNFKMETLGGVLIKQMPASRNAPLSRNSHIYNSQHMGWGYPQFASHEVVASGIRDSLGVVIEVDICEEVSALDPYIVPSKALYGSLEALFEDKTAEVVFKIQAEGDETNERYLYAHRRVLEAQSAYFTKLFGSGFSESTRITSYADLHQGKRTRNKQNNDDNDDDSTEWLATLEDGDDEASIAGVAVESGAVDIDESSAHTDIPANDQIDEMESEGEVSVAASTAEEELAQRNLREVTVVDAGWTTYRALLYWIYTHKLCLTGLHSNYLVYLSSLKAPNAATADDKSSAIDPATPSAPILSRRAWLISQAQKAGRYTSNDRVEPASPHALYRLADKLDMADAKELARRAIVDGFTVENVLFELISTFSYHCAEIQGAALTFCLENWDAVKVTPTFQHVVSEHTRIEGGSEILMKLLVKFPSVPKPAS